MSNGERFPLSYFYYPRDNANCGLHPTQKPIELVRNLIKSYSQPNQTVLDFCMGCYDDQTEILTEDGFVLFKDLQKDQKVASLIDGYLEVRSTNRVF